MNRIIKKYAQFLERSNTVFSKAASKHGVGCKKGCHECCSVGFFDITLLDAIYLRNALKQLPASVRERVLARANEQIDILEKKKAFSRKDPLLKTLPAIDSISRRSAKMSCPALENGSCMIYDQRPHICRIFGPTIRGPRRAVRLEGCGLFNKDIPEADFPIFDHYKEEKKLQKAMFVKAGRKRLREVDTIIPAALTLDLKKWL
jgi:Fe-S-cluster containining protein